MSISGTQWQRIAECTKLASLHVTALSQLKNQLISRKLPELYDDCTKIRSDLLDATLHDVLPHQKKGGGKSGKCMPQPYHLIYFPTPTRLSSLYPDGTDAIHAPGPPFTRRMWAGGDITFDDHLNFRSTRFRCKESITDVNIKGNEGEEKIYVSIRRRIGFGTSDLARHCNSISEFEDPIVENRKLVFMRDRSNRLKTPTASQDVLKFPHMADAKHTFIPTPALLFRFSALTFNAHAIHLDKKYCQEVEGYRNLLVHGPLTLVLMLQFLTERMRSMHGAGKLTEKSHDQIITFVAYRNIAPLYAEEEMTLCMRQKEEHLWDTWIEGPEGGLAVKASVRTAKEPPMQVERDHPTKTFQSSRLDLPKKLGENGSANSEDDLASDEDLDSHEDEKSEMHEESTRSEEDEDDQIDKHTTNRGKTSRTVQKSSKSNPAE
ncbi:MAG: hypothetical protein Q9213_000110 [Squamulea squamosa]